LFRERSVREPVLAEGLHQPVDVAEVIELGRPRTERAPLDELAPPKIPGEVIPRRIMKEPGIGVAALGLAAAALVVGVPEIEPAPRHHATAVVVLEQVDDDVLGRVRGLLLALQPAPGLVNAMAA